MRGFTLKWTEVQERVAGEVPEFPRYTTQILNLANQNAQGTRPKVVGQMSELIQQFQGATYSDWRDWYLAQNPDAIESATERDHSMIDNLRAAIDLIDRDMIRAWVEDLVIAKTFVGFRFQTAVLGALGERLNLPVGKSTPADESQGIDGYLGDKPVSIKPSSYRNKPALTEKIEVPIVYYKKTKSGIKVDPTSL